MENKLNLFIKQLAQWRESVLRVAGMMVLALFILQSSPLKANDYLEKQILGALSEEDIERGRFKQSREFADMMEEFILGLEDELMNIHTVGDLAAYVSRVTNQD